MPKAAPPKPSISEQRLDQLRAMAMRASNDPKLSIAAREAIALLISVVSELHLQIDWLRRDLTSLATPPAPTPAPPKH